MNVYEKSLISVLAVSALLCLIALPLALNKIPRNRLYGYRTRATLADDGMWYAANAYFGKRMLVAVLLGALAMVAIYRIGTLSPDAFIKVSVVMLTVPSGVAALLTHFFIRARLRGR